MARDKDQGPDARRRAGRNLGGYRRPRYSSSISDEEKDQRSRRQPRKYHPAVLILDTHL